MDRFFTMSSVSKKQEELLEWFHPYESCVVAFSGGLDSSVVAKAASLALGKQAVAAMAVSSSCVDGESEQAQSVASSIPIRFISFQSDEMMNASYIANDPQRCYYCKKIRFAKLVEFARENRKEVVVDGSNFDDLDDYRPGRKVLEEFEIRSPLAELGFRKELVRDIAREWKLPNSEMPSSPCLSTRLSYGLEITEERLRCIEKAESYLRELDFSPLRVRMHQNQLARIEVLPEQISRLLEPELRQKIVEEFIKLGFRYVTVELQGFQSGSMNSTG